jgi:hypothetical protein
VIFSTFRPETPAKAPNLSVARGARSLELAKVSPFSLGLPRGVATTGAIARRITSISLGRKSLWTDAEV